MDVAAAAVKQAAGQDGAQPDEEEIPTATVRAAGGSESRGKYERGEREGKPAARAGAAGAKPRGKRGPSGPTARVYIGAGRKSKVRPGDLVGAIANEAGLDSSNIGAIQIAERFSLVEVPEDAVEDVVAALKASTIKGRKVMVRRDRDEA